MSQAFYLGDSESESDHGSAADRTASELPLLVFRNRFFNVHGVDST